MKQTILASQSVGIPFAGENALDLCQPNCDSDAFDEVYTEATQYLSFNIIRSSKVMTFY